MSLKALDKWEYKYGNWGIDVGNKIDIVSNMLNPIRPRHLDVFPEVETIRKNVAEATNFIKEIDSDARWEEHSKALCSSFERALRNIYVSMKDKESRKGSSSRSGNLNIFSNRKDNIHSELISLTATAETVLAAVSLSAPGIVGSMRKSMKVSCKIASLVQNNPKRTYPQDLEHFKSVANQILRDQNFSKMSEEKKQRLWTDTTPLADVLIGPLSINSFIRYFTKHIKSTVTETKNQFLSNTMNEITELTKAEKIEKLLLLGQSPKDIESFLVKEIKALTSPLTYNRQLLGANLNQLQRDAHIELAIWRQIVEAWVQSPRQRIPSVAIREIRKLTDVLSQCYHKSKDGWFSGTLFDIPKPESLPSEFEVAEGISLEKILFRKGRTKGFFDDGLISWALGKDTSYYNPKTDLPLKDLTINARPRIKKAYVSNLMNQSLKEFGLSAEDVRWIEGDGNCSFRAIAENELGTQESWRDIHRHLQEKGVHMDPIGRFQLDNIIVGYAHFPIRDSGPVLLISRVGDQLIRTILTAEGDHEREGVVKDDDKVRAIILQESSHFQMIRPDSITHEISSKIIHSFKTSYQSATSQGDTDLRYCIAYAETLLKMRQSRG